VAEALIDGEAVVFRDDGRSAFRALMTKRGGAQASLVAFALLRLEGEDQRLRPIEARREALMRLVDGVDGILFSTPSTKGKSQRLSGYESAGAGLTPRTFPPQAASAAAA
jgi:ATP-dependent DNA ligase